MTNSIPDHTLEYTCNFWLPHDRKITARCLPQSGRQSFHPWWWIMFLCTQRERRDWRLLWIRSLWLLNAELDETIRWRKVCNNHHRRRAAYLYRTSVRAGGDKGLQFVCCSQSRHSRDRQKDYPNLNNMNNFSRINTFYSLSEIIILWNGFRRQICNWLWRYIRNYLFHQCRKIIYYL